MIEVYYLNDLNDYEFLINILNIIFDNIDIKRYI